MCACVDTCCQQWTGYHTALLTASACCLLLAVLSEATALYREAQAMSPEVNRALEELDNLTPAQSAAAAGSGGSSSATGLVGVQAFGSSSVMDDMALAAAWLAAATGEPSGTNYRPTWLYLHSHSRHVISVSVPRSAPLGILATETSIHMPSRRRACALLCLQAVLLCWWSPADTSHSTGSRRHSGAVPPTTGPATTMQPGLQPLCC